MLLKPENKLDKVLHHACQRLGLLSGIKGKGSPEGSDKLGERLATVHLWVYSSVYLAELLTCEDSGIL